MVIAKPEWFKRRKYLGWGAYPKTWQGWLYLAIAVGILFLVQYLPMSERNKFVATIAIVILLIIDTIDVLFRMKKDERETIHEAKAERNALWAMIIVLCIGVGYQAAQSAISQNVEVDWFILAALGIALVVKAISNIYFDRKD